MAKSSSVISPEGNNAGETHPRLTSERWVTRQCCFGDRMRESFAGLLQASLLAGRHAKCALHTGGNLVILAGFCGSEGTARRPARQGRIHFTQPQRLGRKFGRRAQTENHSVRMSPDGRWMRIRSGPGGRPRKLAIPFASVTIWVVADGRSTVTEYSPDGKT